MAVPKSLGEALLNVQRNAPKIQKDGLNPAFRGSKYIKLDSLLPQILPLLNENGLLLSQLPSFISEGYAPVPALTTRITFIASGFPPESIEATAPLVLEKENSQGVGSAITYMRRYALLSILGLSADEDDDGNKASPKRGKPAVVNPAKSDY
jgi:hypothetical protein